MTSRDSVGIKGVELPQVNVDFPKAQGFLAKVGGTYFRAAASPETPLRYYTRDSLAQRSDDKGSIYENVLDIGYVFSRTNYSGGEGLDWDPRELSVEQATTALDQIKYWDSKGVDVTRPLSGEPFVLRLSQEQELAPQTFTGDPSTQAVSLTRWYVGGDATIEWYQNLDDLVPEGSQTFVTNIVKVVATPHDDVFVLLATSGEIWMKPAGETAFILLWDPSGEVGNDQWPPINMWWVKERLMAARIDPTNLSSTELVELGIVVTGPPGNPTLTPTAFLIDTVDAFINDVIGSGPAMVACETNGNLRTYVTRTDTQGGVPQLTIHSQMKVPTGEVPIVLGDVAGILLIQTIDQPDPTGKHTVRLYQAEVLDSRFDFVVGQLQFLRQWNNSFEPFLNQKRNVISSRDNAFFTVHEEDDISYIWKFDAVTGGVSRTFTSVNANVDSLVIFDNTVLWISEETPSVVRRLSADPIAEGYLITPNITFGLNTDINWIANNVEARNFEADSKVELYFSDDPLAILDPDHPSWVLDRRIQVESQSDNEKAMLNVSSRTLALQFKIFRGSDDGGVTYTSPEITRLGLRGLPTHRDWIVELPVNVSDFIEVPYRRPMRVPDYGDKVHNAMLALQGAHVELLILDPPFAFRGVVDNIVTPVPYISKRGSVGRVCVLQFRGNRITATAFPSGTAGLGIGTLGIGTLGLAQDFTP
jgi:hypothetical protein